VTNLTLTPLHLWRFFNQSVIEMLRQVHMMGRPSVLPEKNPSTWWCRP